MKPRMQSFLARRELDRAAAPQLSLKPSPVPTPVQNDDCSGPVYFDSIVGRNKTQKKAAETEMDAPDKDEWDALADDETLSPAAAARRGRQLVRSIFRHSGFAAVAGAAHTSAVTWRWRGQHAHLSNRVVRRFSPCVVRYFASHIVKFIPRYLECRRLALEKVQLERQYITQRMSTTAAKDSMSQDSERLGVLQIQAAESASGAPAGAASPAALSEATNVEQAVAQMKQKQLEEMRRVLPIEDADATEPAGIYRATDFVPDWLLSDDSVPSEPFATCLRSGIRDVEKYTRTTRAALQCYRNRKVDGAIVLKKTAELKVARKLHVLNWLVKMNLFTRKDFRGTERVEKLLRTEGMPDAPLPPAESRVVGRDDFVIDRRQSGLLLLWLVHAASERVAVPRDFLRWIWPAY
eukprot:Polyplicarium_translucidae@DN1233_c0_g1_i2.p1